VHLPARPTCAVKGACKGVHQSEAETLYSAGPGWANEPMKCNSLNGTFRSMLSYLHLPAEESTSGLPTNHEQTTCWTKKAIVRCHNSVGEQ
jgi:hypothetical protein